jgi:hypothetical protein
MFYLVNDTCEKSFQLLMALPGQTRSLRYVGAVIEGKRRLCAVRG